MAKRTISELPERKEIDNSDSLIVETVEGTMRTSKEKLLKEVALSDSLSLNRIGRKRELSVQGSSIGTPSMMQGGCLVDDSTVAYVLWDNSNITLNKNRVVVMNLQTGEELVSKSVSYGWCNSMTYYEDKLFIAERGTTTVSGSYHSGRIRVLRQQTLEELAIFNLDVNVNALSIYGEHIYVLEEGTSNIFLYTLGGYKTGKRVVIKPSIQGLYNQNIKVTEDFIFLLSTKPTYCLHIFNHEGDLVKCINIDKYAGIYFIGEPQFLDFFTNGEFLFGSSSTYPSECINQFFKGSLVKGKAYIQHEVSTAQTVYVKSTVDNYLADGTEGNEFTSVQECVNLNIRNIIIDGSSSEYLYTYISDSEKYIRIRNAVFGRGLYVQYSNLTLDNCSIKYAIGGEINACLSLRDTHLVVNNVIFDALGNSDCIIAERSNFIKLSSPKFNNYRGLTIASSGTGNLISCKVEGNLPYIPNSDIRSYSLFPTFINEYEVGKYSYNTSLSVGEIQTIISNCNRVRIVYNPFNNRTKVIELIKSSDNTYSFTESTVSSGVVNVRICKIQLVVNANGLEIVSNATTVFKDNNWSVVVPSISSTTNEDFISIRSVEFCI